MYKHTTLMIHVLSTVVHLKVCQQKIDYTSEKQVEAERYTNLYLRDRKNVIIQQSDKQLE